MPSAQKRRAPVETNDSPWPALSDDDDDPNPPPSRRRRRSSSSVDDSGQALEDGGTQEDGTSKEQMVKKMVRLALASEYARQPIRRSDIAAKVLGQNSRQFRSVFEGAQKVLQATFGMEMVELPIRDKVTISQRRAAQRVDKASTTSKAYVLTSVLPPKYRMDSRILPPPKVPTSETEGAYIGLYTFLISVISLSGGSIGEAKLERYLKRTNADQSTPIDKTEKLLARLCKEGYLVKVKDSSAGEEIVEYMVGPRGKVEVDVDAITGMARTVYGEGAMDDLDDRVRRSMGLDENKRKKKKKKKARKGSASTPGRSGGRGQTDEAEGEEEDDDDDDDDDDDGEDSHDDSNAE